MAYSQNDGKLQGKSDDYQYLKLSDGAGFGYQDLWRGGGSPGKCDMSRSPLDLNLTPSYAQMTPTYDMESLQPLLPFSPNYKDFPPFKEKNPSDVADTLLSLKHAVVHPHLTGQLSLSPTMHLGPVTPGLSNQGQQSLSYSVNHGTQGHPMAYSGRNSPQYPSVHAQFHSEHMQPHVHQQQSMFPAMSVNVSMSMNVVPPNFVNNQYTTNQQWATSQPHHYSMGQEYPHSSPGGVRPTQYSPYSPTNHHYAQPYSASSDFRSAVTEGRNYYYKSSEGFTDPPRHYDSSQIKRTKYVEDKYVHLVQGSENGKLNLCRICGKTYARPSTLKTHLRTHSGEKPYKCSTCSKSFSQAANLTAHIRTHSGEKPFHCPVCDRHFSQSSSVTTHMRTHSGERPYRCRLCKKAFSDSSTLTKHLRIHSGEKPYQCKLCLLRFSQSGNLNRHMRVHSSNG